MGRIIVCSGKRANQPFCPDYTGRKLYSAEELCYYVYHSLYGIEESFFSEELFAWLENECGLTEEAGRLRELKGRQAAVKVRELVVMLLCITDFFTEEEIRRIMKILEEFDHLPVWKKRKLLADEYIRCGKYREAKTEYERLLHRKEAAAYNEQEYGNILHNIGVADIFTSTYREAFENFLAAYRQCRKEEYLKHCLYACRLGGLSAEYQRVVQEEAVPDKLIKSVEEDIGKAEHEAGETAEFKALKRVFAARREGHVSDYYQRISEILEDFKAEYRKGI